MSPKSGAPPRVRIDRLLVDRGLAPSREKAQAIILAGLVTAAGRRVDKAGALIAPTEVIAVTPTARFVGRGGEKLDGAIGALGLDVGGIEALDVGASTGGFTDCLLQRGARSVMALDVGKGQLDWTLRNDPRVSVREGVNVRYLDDPALRGAFDLITVDVSFISLRWVLPALVPCIRREDAPPLGSILALVKPQFEVGRAGVGRGGIVRDPELQLGAVLEILRCARRMRVLPATEQDRTFWARAEVPPGSSGEPGADETVLDAAATIESPIRGAEGNREFFVLLRPGPCGPWASIEDSARRAVTAGDLPGRTQGKP